MSPALDAPASAGIAPEVADLTTMTSAAPYALVFVAALLLALPGLAMALYLYAVGQVAGSGGWLRAFFELLFSGVVILPMVLLGAVLLLLAGLFPSVRPWASLALLLLNAGVLTVSWRLQPPTALADLTVWLPTGTSIALAAWLAWRAFGR